MRQQIRESSSEIRELEAKLRQAYVAKEQQAQMTEKRALVMDEAVSAFVFLLQICNFHHATH